MAGNNSVASVILLNAGVMTGTNKISSQPLVIPNTTHVAFSAVWTGSPTGSFVIEISVDGVNYDSLGISILNAGDANATNAQARVVNMYGIAVKYVRMSYTNATGTGSLTITGMAKGN